MRVDLTARKAVLATAASRLIAAMGLQKRVRAEIRDLYSHPISAHRVSDLSRVLHLTRRRERPSGPHLAA